MKLGVGLLAWSVSVASAAGQSPPPAGWLTLGGERRDGAAMNRFLDRLTEQAGVTALSVAVVDGGRIVYARTRGRVQSRRGRAADERTVFRAASLSKPVFSYLVMKLADRGVLDLDTPIHRYLPRPLYAYPGYASFRDDLRYERLTARLLLSHRGGLPNWRRDRPNGAIAFLATPGDHFAYSGEGYALLQFVVETLSGRDLARLAREMVFEPLGMRDSSFLWEGRFDGRFAADLDGPLGALVEQTRRRGNAAGSLITNASDYAAFVAAVMDGSGLRSDTRAAWLAPEVAITSRSLFGEPGTDRGANRAPALAWTPGWGTFEDRHDRALFHVGLEEGCENFVEIFTGRKLGVVFFALTDNAHSFSAPLVEYALGRAFSPLDWLEYGDDALSTAGNRLLWYGVVALATAAAPLVVLWLRRRSR